MVNRVHATPCRICNYGSPCLAAVGFSSAQGLLTSRLCRFILQGSVGIVSSKMSAGDQSLVLLSAAAGRLFFVRSSLLSPSKHNVCCMCSIANCRCSSDAAFETRIPPVDFMIDVTMLMCDRQPCHLDSSAICRQQRHDSFSPVNLINNTHAGHAHVSEFSPCFHDEA